MLFDIKPVMSLLAEHGNSFTFTPYCKETDTISFFCLITLLVCKVKSQFVSNLVYHSVDVHCGDAGGITFKPTHTQFVLWKAITTYIFFLI